MTSLRQNAAWLAVLLPLAGCGPAGVAFVPSRAVDSANVDRLTLVLCAKFQQESVLDRLSEGVNAIGPVAVDSEAGLLYVHRQVRVGLSYGSPVMIDTYDLGSGRLVHKTRIPDAIDLSGAATYSAAAWIDTQYRAAYVDKRPAPAPAACPPSPSARWCFD